MEEESFNFLVESLTFSNALEASLAASFAESAASEDLLDVFTKYALVESDEEETTFIVRFESFLAISESKLTILSQHFSDITPSSEVLVSSELIASLIKYPLSKPTASPPNPLPLLLVGLLVVVLRGVEGFLEVFDLLLLLVPAPGIPAVPALDV